VFVKLFYLIKGTDDCKQCDALLHIKAKKTSKLYHSELIFIVFQHQ